jgi:hypothetical protein
METQPRLKTICMVKKAIEADSGSYSIYPLWKRLPKKMMYQTYKTIINHLLDNNEIMIDGSGKISCLKTPSGLGDTNREDIISSLSHYGYDIISLKKIRKQKAISLNDLIIDILIRHPEARFIEAIPTLMIKNKIDYFELYRKAYDYGLVNALGFLIEVSFILAGKKDIGYLKPLLAELKKQRDDRIHYVGDIREKDFLEKRTPDIMRKWNLRGMFSIDDFRKEAYS